jgi:hypothetical protein
LLSFGKIPLDRKILKAQNKIVPKNMHPLFWPYLVGLIPIFFARSWPARVVAILFGLVSIGFGFYYIWSIHNGTDVSTAVQQAGRAVIGALSIAAVSAIATYFVDKKKQNK